MNVETWKQSLPTPRHEDWKYTSLAALKQAALEPVQAPPRVSGHADADAAVIEHALVGGEDAFSRLASDSTHLHVREDRTLTIEHLAADGALASSRVHVHVHAGTVEIVERFRGEGVHAAAPVLTIDVERGATVRYIRVIEEAPRGFHVGRVSARVDGALHIASLAIGGKITRTRIDVALGQGATVEMDGLALAGRDSLVDHHTFVEHTGTDGTTRQRFRNVADAGGRAVFTGRILVDVGAVRTDASQHAHSLLLHDDAAANVRPQLEILTDDVKCTHGAAVGQLDPEALFFLRARGIGAEEARRLLTWAFVQQACASIPDAHRAPIDASVDQWLTRLGAA